MFLWFMTMILDKKNAINIEKYGPILLKLQYGQLQHSTADLFRPAQKNDQLHLTSFEDMTQQAQS